MTTESIATAIAGLATICLNRNMDNYNKDLWICVSAGRMK